MIARPNLVPRRRNNNHNPHKIRVAYSTTQTPTIHQLLCLPINITPGICRSDQTTPSGKVVGNGSQESGTLVQPAETLAQLRQRIIQDLEAPKDYRPKACVDMSVWI